MRAAGTRIFARTLSPRSRTSWRPPPIAGPSRNTSTTLKKSGARANNKSATSGQTSAAGISTSGCTRWWNWPRGTSRRPSWWIEVRVPGTTPSGVRPIETAAAKSLRKCCTSNFLRLHSRPPKPTNTTPSSNPSSHSAHDQRKSPKVQLKGSTKAESPAFPLKNKEKARLSKRRGRDSNPGYPHGYSGFQDR